MHALYTPFPLLSLTVQASAQSVPTPGAGLESRWPHLQPILHCWLHLTCGDCPEEEWECSHHCPLQVSQGLAVGVEWASPLWTHLGTSLIREGTSALIRRWLIVLINPWHACARVTVLVNPRHACARVTVLVLSDCLCVCVSVCFPYSGTSRNQAYKQQYQRLQRDTGMKYKKGFFFKTLRSEVMASFTHLE